MTSPNTIIADMNLVETNLRQQIAHLNDEIAGLKSDVAYVKKQRDEWRDASLINEKLRIDIRLQRDEWRERAEFSYAERSKLERKLNELLEALEELNSVSARGFLYDDPARINARKAIALAKGGS